MTNQSADEILSDYEKKLISREELTKKLIEHIFINRFKYGLHFLTEDETSDFIINMYSRILGIVKVYKKNEGCFEKFFASCVLITAKYYKRKRVLADAHDKCLCLISNRIYDDKKYEYSNNEQVLKLEDESFMHSVEEIRRLKNKKTFEELLSRKSRKPVLKSKSILEGKNLFQEALIILAVKSCYYVDYDFKLKIAELTEISMEILDELIKKALSTMAAKIERFKMLQKRRNQSWYFRNKYMLMKNFNLNKHWTEEIARKYKRQTDIWKNCINIIRNHSNLVTPSNVAVAEILGTDHRHIAYVLKKIETDIDSFKLKWYSVPHENISGKQQFK